jgi:transposase
MVVGYEAGRDGFWLARWLSARGIEVYVIHPTSIAVSREHRRAKTDRLDIGPLKRALLGWLRGEEKHLGAAAPKCFSAEQIILRSGTVPLYIYATNNVLRSA